MSFETKIYVLNNFAAKWHKDLYDATIPEQTLALSVAEDCIKLGASVVSLEEMNEVYPDAISDFIAFDNSSENFTDYNELRNIIFTKAIECLYRDPIRSLPNLFWFDKALKRLGELTDTDVIKESLEADANELPDIYTDYDIEIHEEDEDSYGEEPRSDSESNDNGGFNNRLPYGLCKKAGIEVPEGTDYSGAWKLFTDKTGITEEEALKQLDENGEVDLSSINNAEQTEEKSGESIDETISKENEVNQSANSKYHATDIYDSASFYNDLYAYGFSTKESWMDAQDIFVDTEHSFDALVQKSIHDLKDMDDVEECILYIATMNNDSKYIIAELNDYYGIRELDESTKNSIIDKAKSVDKKITSVYNMLHSVQECLDTLNEYLAEDYDSHPVDAEHYFTILNDLNGEQIDNVLNNSQYVPDYLKEVLTEFRNDLRNRNEDSNNPFTKAFLKKIKSYYLVTKAMNYHKWIAKQKSYLFDEFYHEEYDNALEELKSINPALANCYKKYEKMLDDRSSNIRYMLSCINEFKEKIEGLDDEGIDALFLEYNKNIKWIGQQLIENTAEYKFNYGIKSSEPINEIFYGQLINEVLSAHDKFEELDTIVTNAHKACLKKHMGNSPSVPDDGFYKSTNGEVEIDGTAHEYGCIHNEEAFTDERRNNAVWNQSIRDTMEYMSPYLEETYGNMSPEERSVIRFYTEGSSFINAPLQGFQPGSGSYHIGNEVYYNFVGIDAVQWDDDHKEECNILTKAIGRTELHDDMWVQHGADVDQFKTMIGFDAFDYSKAYHGDMDDINAYLDSLIEADKELYYPAVMSCGGARGTGFAGRPIIYNIYCPRGTKAIYASPISKYGGVDKWESYTGQDLFSSEYSASCTENEFLLQRGSVLKLRKYAWQCDTLYLDFDLIAQKPHELPE